MRLLSLLTFLAAALALSAGSAGLAEDPKPKPHREKALVSKDGAKMFKAESMKLVSEAAERLLKEKATDFVIETIATPPKGDVEKVRSMKNDEREKYFQGQVNERAKTDKLQGISILICKSPNYFYVGTTGDAHFPSEAGSKIRNTIRDAMREKKLDEGLTKAIAIALEAKGLGEK